MHLTLRGEIRTGKGNFSYWLDKLEPYYTRKTGMRLFPGTLNVHLTSGSYRTPANALRLKKEEYVVEFLSASCPARSSVGKHSSFGLTPTPANMEIRLKGSLRSPQTIAGRLLYQGAGRYRRTDSITAPGTPIPLTTDTFCYPPVTRTRSHLAIRVCSSSILITLVRAPRNGAFLPPVTTRMRCRRKAIRVWLTEK
jgi:hypothetical protein